LEQNQSCHCWVKEDQKEHCDKKLETEKSDSVAPLNERPRDH
jgi:hypothetical protein